MLNAERLVRRRKTEELPPDIYVSIVDSLHSDQRSLLIGSTTAAVAAFLTAAKIGNAAIFFVAIAMAVVGVLRVVDLSLYHRDRARLFTVADAQHRERRYITGAVVHIVLFGVWCLFGMLYTDDSFVHLLSFSITIGYMVGISGRNFGSNLLVTLQVLGAGAPMIVGLVLHGNSSYIVLAFFLAPFLVSLKSISTRLRNTLLDEVKATREMSLLAERFDTALNNMPHGLAMFDAGQHLVVANRRLGELFGIGPTEHRRGVTVRELVQDCVEAGTVLRFDSDNVASDIENRLLGGTNAKLFIETPDGRTLDLTFQPMENGGSVVLVEDITERRNAEAQIRHLARFDALTGLPNRTFFRDQMERALAGLRTGESGSAVLFVDLDRFKQVNDTLGHPAGDLLLCSVSDRLRSLTRPTDIVARFGGDEFIILQSPVSGAQEVAELARGIIDALGRNYEVDGHEVVIGASIGIALAPKDGTGADHLLKNADMALYRAKAEGRGAWKFFEPAMDVQAQKRRNLELDLRNALATDAFQIYYQPLLNLKTKRVSTCEALLRWPHPERGMVSPAEFIPVAEEMGLIVEIGTWVLRQACQECARWPADVRVAVNLSPIQFQRGNIAATIAEALQSAGLPANRLEVEITESVLLQDTHATRLTLQQLRDLGVRISLDDFGTGYSSLSYLHSFPLHKVKIDRSFLEGLGSNERPLKLLRGVARLSAELGMTVAVEGIETEEQLMLIASEAAVDEAQGWLFSPAVPGNQIRKLLGASSARPEHASDRGGGGGFRRALGWH